MQTLVVKTKVKEIVGKLNITAEYFEMLNVKAEELIKESMRRAEKNNRKTLMARDL